MPSCSRCLQIETPERPLTEVDSRDYLPNYKYCPRCLELSPAESNEFGLYILMGIVGFSCIVCIPMGMLAFFCGADKIARSSSVLFLIPVGVFLIILTFWLYARYKVKRIERKWQLIEKNRI